jgi:hypothetical protein
MPKPNLLPLEILMLSRLLADFDGHLDLSGDKLNATSVLARDRLQAGAYAFA